MGYMKDYLSSSLRRRPHEVPVAEAEPTESELQTKENGPVQDVHEAIDSDGISYDAQPGVQKMEATTKTWTMPWLITTYILYVFGAERRQAVTRSGSG